MYVDEYAKVGLRTLLLAKKDIDPQYYAQWNEKFQEAQSSVVDKDEKVEIIQSEIESELMLVGSTAIEDRLQENVKETIEAFKETGIKVWVLTGDKVETAINIGFSCGLLNDSMSQYIIDTTVESEILQKLKDVETKKKSGQIRSSGGKEALIISGSALTRV